ncbi:sulfite oxidase-like oxidoreductase [Bacillus sp. RAR_GA_16]|uniref:sulfite oxidase-like oxidoreductase n=1 Tax=Bacillus sp. RAR_GA_16 TaxID=2876774 RepID=UPI001CCA667D|nr:sulfite oxidase-like oxidoreductase [Bacillus sp. RAR_GA_16]MCA0170950.1 sulfite oxidase-like oxidoreductase [Bacillus sp. RAR_GA_16]
MKKAARIRNMKVPQANEIYGDRLPPGQVLTERFPILHEGEVPVYDMTTWDLKVFGKLAQEITVDYEDLLALPQKQVTCDIHCVTRWSRFDNTFEGVLMKDFMKELGIHPESEYVMLHGDHDYTTNIHLHDLIQDNVLLAHSVDGEKLTAKHGYPLRLVVPHLYFWKSIKWIRGIEFISEDAPGFWEQNGFHNHADPFKEERFSGEDLGLPDDEWEKKEYD